MRINNKEFLRKPITDSSSYLISGETETHRSLFLNKLLTIINKKESHKKTYTLETKEELNSLLNELQSYSLFAERCVYIIKLKKSKLDKLKSTALLEAFSLCDQEKRLIVCTPFIKRQEEKQEWVQHALKTAPLIELLKLTKNELILWSKKKLSVHQLEIEPKALDFLISQTEGNLEALNQELEKLSLRYQHQTITLLELEKQLFFQGNFNIYQLSEAYLNQDLNRSLVIFSSLKHSGEEPLLLLWLTSKDVRLLFELLRLREGGIDFFQACQKLKIWAKDKALYQKALVTLEKKDLALLLRRLADCEKIIKGQLDGNAWDLLETCILYLASRDPNLKKKLNASSSFF